MFKLQNPLQSMDVTKNTERYRFKPAINEKRQTAFNTLQKSVYTNSITNNSTSKNRFYSTGKISIKDNYKNVNFPPVYFYRKVSSPYKYSMTSVPEYLIKTNEEKHFIDKLYSSITNETDKNTLDNLINKNKKEGKKDFYKPSYIEVQKLLKYKPDIYSGPFKPDTKLKTYNFVEKEKNNPDLEEKKYYNNMLNNDNEEENYEKNINIPVNKNEKFETIIPYKEKEEISKEKQIKYKYTLSDVFNLRQEPVFTNKSAEKYYFKEKENNKNNYVTTCPNNIENKQEKKIKINNYDNENHFYNGSQSQSDWIPNKTYNNKMNTHSSVSYNILSPCFKGLNRFKNATELNKENKFNENQAYHRVKSISEFIDLTRVSATNTLGCFNINKKMPNFRFCNSVATNQLDEYHINKDLIEKPI